MKKKIFIFLFILFSALLTTAPIQAQVPLKLDAKSMMSINGTSSLHDWESDVTTLQLSGTGNPKNGKLTSIKFLSLTVPVKSIKSGKSLMDNKTYEALKADKYPDIKFELVSSEFSGSKIKGNGKLTIAGKTNNISVDADYLFTSSSVLTVKGTQKIDMTDFEIAPPTALMGSITTGKEITILYTIIINY
ncbi:MAG TPA: hypothetical protein DD653_07830 [Marinilabiliales bacterium]|nr:MAG: hypothetical protein A2W84_10580 [Bacteroidetes bacterium GWC2_40_13]HBO74580.1 hypothetical protein [Marinilabiliales bacterium]